MKRVLLGAVAAALYTAMMAGASAATAPPCNEVLTQAAVMHIDVGKALATKETMVTLNQQALARASPGLAGTDRISKIGAGSGGIQRSDFAFVRASEETWTAPAILGQHHNGGGSGGKPAGAFASNAEHPAVLGIQHAVTAT